jgi:outer membrane protein assembly factor BamB
MTTLGAARITQTVLVVTAVSVSSVVACGGWAENADENWPQWRGPRQTGEAHRANPPTEWSESKNVRWKVKVAGEGLATPVVWDNRVLVLTAINTGKKGEATAARRPNDGASPRGPQPGSPPGQRRGGEGGGSRFGASSVLAGRLFAAGDKDEDKKLTADELSAVAATWFAALDSDSAGTLSQDQFPERLGKLFGSAAANNREVLAGRLIAPRLFAAIDSNKDGSVTADEWRATFAKWYADWDAEKTGAVSEEQVRGGLGTALPRPEGDGPGFGGGPGGGGFGGMSGPPPSELHQFAIVCLDRQTGKVLWQQVAREEVPHEGHHRSDGSFAAPSPVTDGQRIYAYFGSRGLYCYDMDGKLQWSQDFGDMRIAATFGEGSSPVLAGDAVIVNWDHEGESFIIALDKKTGGTLWRKPRDERTSWSTPLVVEHNGKQQVVTSASGRIRSYDAASGELVWECSGMTRNVIPSPVAAEGMVYCISGFQGSSLLAIRLGSTGDLNASDAVAWRHNRNTPYVPSPLLYEDKLYFFASNNGVLSCLDAKTGRVLIEPARVPGLRGVYASPVGAGGYVFLIGREGATVVIKNTGQLDVVATNELDDRFDASPAIAGNELFLRGREHLYCIARE